MDKRNDKFIAMLEKKLKKYEEVSKSHPNEQERLCAKEKIKITRMILGRAKKMQANNQPYSDMKENIKDWKRLIKAACLSYNAKVGLESFVNWCDTVMISM